MKKILLKVDRTGSGIRDYTILLNKLDKSLFSISNSIKREKDNSFIIYQIGNSSRAMLIDFLLNHRSRRAIELHDLLAGKRYLNVFYPFILDFFLSKAEMIILHSYEAKRLFLKKYGKKHLDKVVIIPLLLFKSDMHSIDIIPHAKKIKFLIAGHIKKSKGIFEILEAYLNVPKPVRTKSNLFIAGKINKRVLIKILKYKRLMPNEIIIINKYLSEKELNRLILNADYLFNFKIEDKGESSGIVSKAIYMEKPIITSKIGSNIEHFNMSSLILPIDIPSLSKKIELCITHKNVIIQKEKKIIKRLKESLSDKNILKRYKTVYNDKV